MFFNFLFKFWSINCNLSEIWAHCACLKVTSGGHFDFKILETKFCLLTQSIISITKVFLEFLKKWQVFGLTAQAASFQSHKATICFL